MTGNEISPAHEEPQGELGYAFHTKLRAPAHRSSDAAGPETFGKKYMPFAAGKKPKLVDLSSTLYWNSDLGYVKLNNPFPPSLSGFAHMASEAPVYRTSRLHMINPTAAVSDDISFYYTLDSGRVSPAAVAANPETSAEFVRNTSTQSHGGMFRRLMKPIQ